MSLPEGVISYLNENARTQGVAPPAPQDDLFKAGVLDSFTLVDFVTMLEEQCGIKIPDGDVRAENFNTLASIERYVAARGGDAR
jgi:acyl carrier protein